ncbi:TetR/AcrR family transcriptional regulator [Nocardia sp. NPDC051030]|uniref:TetR/AcrR family transcriptional regulator n=1 Tax=Nocardia sp. NPDC051030 TaxID=3155162 RepID=UPI00343C0220
MELPIDMRPHRRRAGGRRWKEHNSARKTQIMTAAVALIEEQDPGSEISIQQIANRAGLARSVIYRQFEHREDLDAHVREFILGLYLEGYEDLLVLDPAKTVEQIILDVIREIVEWAAEHPRLYRYGQSGPVHGHAAGETSISIARHRIAETLWQRISSGTAVFGIDVSPFRPLIYGVIGMVEGVVTEYIDTTVDSGQQTVERTAVMLAASTWHLIAGHAADQGLHFERSATVATLLGQLFADASGKSDRTSDGH